MRRRGDGARPKACANSLQIQSLSGSKPGFANLPAGELKQRVGGMTCETMGDAALEYFPCRYGASKLTFRGPQRRLEGDYAAYLGGIETYGKFTVLPFPALVEQETGLRSVNLGCANAGIDAYLRDSSAMEICARARATVIQIMGAQNMSNRFYTVHPRRNDRFVSASNLLRRIYPEVDFTEFHFTRHMLTTLADADPEKFARVREELRQAWVARMRTLIDQIGGKVVLLWLASHEPDHSRQASIRRAEPLFVERGMIEAVRSHADAVVEVVATRDEVTAGNDELVFATMERPAAQEMLGPVVHRRAACELAPVLRRLVEPRAA